MRKQNRNKQAFNQSRRRFLKLNWSEPSKKALKPAEAATKKQKMLMADGTLVEVNLSSLPQIGQVNMSTNTSPPFSLEYSLIL